jgi:DNA invertase Pin-like site-specific DNA recombinase
MRPGVLVERIDMGAVSGAADVRPDLARLFVLLEARAIDEVRVRHLDRLTRHDDLRQRAEIFGRLLDAHAVIVDGSGHVIDPATELGELDYSLQTWMSAKERRRIHERTQAGRKRKAAEGQIQGRPPYARTWDKRTATWGEDHEAMRIYRRIFAEVIRGRSLAEVAEGLNRSGITTPRGRAWTPAHVSRLVRARSAAGVIEGWGREFRCPAVVSEADWREAAAALARSRQQRAGPPGHHPAMLRRVLRCGACGSSMWVQRGGRAGDLRTYYVCSRYRTAEEKACRTYHAAERVDGAVRDLILADLRQPARLRAAAHRKEGGDPLAEARARVETADRELRILARRTENLLRILSQESVPEESGRSQLREIAQLRNAAEVERISAAARVDALSAAAKRAAGDGERLTEIADRLERAGLARWVRFLREQMPEGYGVRLWPDGHFTVSGRWDPVGVARAARR